MIFSPWNQVLVDLKALSHNFTVIENRLSNPDQKIIAIVKSDAYGHGMVQVAKVLCGRDRLWGFGVAEVEEARELRKSGIKVPIILISGILQDKDLIDTAFGLDCTVGVSSRGELELLDLRGASLGKTIKVHLKVDTGMSRFGMEMAEALDVLRERRRFAHLEFTGAYSHLACADEPLSPQNQVQVERFKDFLRECGQLGWHPKETHLLNSAGIFLNSKLEAESSTPKAQSSDAFSLVRPGIAIYGALDENPTHGLLPVMSFKTRIQLVKHVPTGAQIGYGGACKVMRPSKLGIIPVGYHDGYMRSLSSKAHVLVRGKRARVMGRISMRSTVVDLTDVPEAGVGDEVVLFGSQGAQRISVCELARVAGTISYEILCLVGTRNKKVFLGKDAAEGKTCLA